MNSHLIAQAAAQTATDIFGKISAPPGVSGFGNDPSGGGLIIFISNLIKVITIVAGLFGLFNIISAGFLYLGSSGNPKAAEEAGQKLLFSLIGLAVIVGSFTITAIVSLILFGNPGFILNPVLPTPMPAVK